MVTNNIIENYRYIISFTTLGSVVTQPIFQKACARSLKSPPKFLQVPAGGWIEMTGNQAYTTFLESEFIAID